MFLSNSAIAVPSLKGKIYWVHLGDHPFNFHSIDRFNSVLVLNKYFHQKSYYCIKILKYQNSLTIHKLNIQHFKKWTKHKLAKVLLLILILKAICNLFIADR